MKLGSVAMSNGRRYLLDTHVVISLGIRGGLDTLPDKVRRILENPESELLVSVASQVEVAIKNQLGKLELSREELLLVCRNADINWYPVRSRHADQLFGLPMHHKDPFDRLIIGTALSDDLPVISKDEQFRRYKELQIVW